MSQNTQLARVENKLTVVQGANSIEALRNREQATRQIIKDTICRGATDAELDFICLYQEHMQLDVIARQIWAYKSRLWDNTAKQYVETLLVFPSIDGYRILADRTGFFDGMTAPQFCGPDGQFSKLWLSKDNPTACVVEVYRKDRKIPVEFIAQWDQWAKYATDKSTKERYLSGKWKETGPYMLSITAERQALKRAFVNDIRGENKRLERVLTVAPDQKLLEVEEEELIGPGNMLTDSQVIAAQVEIAEATEEAAKNRSYSMPSSTPEEAWDAEFADEQPDTRMLWREQFQAAKAFIGRLSPTRRKAFLDEIETELGNSNIAQMDAEKLNIVIRKFADDEWGLLLDIPEHDPNAQILVPKAVAETQAKERAVVKRLEFISQVDDLRREIWAGDDKGWAGWLQHFFGVSLAGRIKDNEMLLDLIEAIKQSVAAYAGPHKDPYAIDRKPFLATAEIPAQPVAAVTTLPSPPDQERDEEEMDDPFADN